VFTIDASVWVAAERPVEPGHADADALLDAIAEADVEVVEPWLVLAEMAGALRRAHGDGALALAAARRLAVLPAVRFVALDRALADESARLAATHGLRGADAVYVATARAAGFPLVSLDREQLTRRPPDVEALTPAEALARLNARP